MVNDERAAKLYMKKATLKAWAMILHKQGKIDLHKCNRMVALIDKLSA